MKIILGFIIVIILVVFGYSYSKKPKDTNLQDSVANSSNVALTTKEDEKYLVLSKELIAKHKTADDCWLYIDNSAYVVTNFLQMHSGGPDKILPYCGGDATGAFKSRVHSEGAKLLLKRLNLGKIDEKILITEVDKVLKDDLFEPSD